MSLFGTVKKIINIVDWVTSRYDGVKNYVKKKIKARRARKIRQAIDSNNKSHINKRLQDIVKKRRERRDSA